MNGFIFLTNVKVNVSVSGVLFSKRCPRIFRDPQQNEKWMNVSVVFLANG